MKRSIIRCLTFLILLILLLTACTSSPAAPGGQDEGDSTQETEGGEQEEGEESGGGEQEAEAVDLSGEKIEVILIGDLSGPQASLTTPTIRGVQDAVEALNQQGGVHGGEMSLATIDNGGLVEETLAAFQEVADDASLVIVVSPEDAGALMEMAAEAELPVLNLGNVVPPAPEEGENYIFSLAMTQPAQFEYFLDFLADQWEQVKPTGAEEQIKLTYLSWPEEIDQPALTPETRMHAQSLGIEIVTEAIFSASMTEDLVDELIAAQRAGANVIYTNTWLHGPAVLLNDLHAIALADDYLVAGPASGMDATTYGFLRQPDFYDNFYAPFNLAWWSDADNTGVQLALESVEASERGIAAQTQGYLLGMAGADMARQVLEETVQEVGLSRLSGETVYIALSTLSDYPALDGLLTVDFSQGSRSLAPTQMRQVEGFMNFLVRYE